MAITQISKIQLRRGVEADLPGAPITTIPPAFGPGLDVGELAFTTDTGRLFVGVDPEVGDYTYNRITFPYQNIEVLTENSRPRLQTLYDGFAKDMRSAYVKSRYTVSGNGLPINANSSDWTTVTIPDPSGDLTLSPVNLRLDIPGNVGCYAQLTYFVIDNASTVPLSLGTMRVLWDGGVSSPTFSDTSINIIPSGTLTFRALMVMDGPNATIVLQACNLTTYHPYFYYRIERPTIV